MRKPASAFAWFWKLVGIKINPDPTGLTLLSFEVKGTNAKLVSKESPMLLSVNWFGTLFESMAGILAMGEAGILFVGTAGISFSCEGGLLFILCMASSTCELNGLSTREAMALFGSDIGSLFCMLFPGRRGRELVGIFRNPKSRSKEEPLTPESPLLLSLLLLLLFAPIILLLLSPTVVVPGPDDGFGPAESELDVPITRSSLRSVQQRKKFITHVHLRNP